MNIRTMRRLDRWVGTPVCLGLTVVRKLVDLVRRIGGLGRGAAVLNPAAGAAQRGPVVLLVKLAEMGSTVLALPAITRLREMYPGCRLHYLCLAENRAVLDLIDEIPWAGVHGIRADSIVSAVWNTLTTVRRIRRLRPDVAIDLECFSRTSAALVHLSGARVRVGFHRYRAEGLNCGDLFTHRLAYNNHLHTAGAFLSLVEALAAPPAEVPLLKKRIVPPQALPSFRPTEQEREAVLARLRDGGFPGPGRGSILIINTNASDLLPLRRWPTGRFEELARRCLAADERTWIVLTGAPSEQPAVEAFARALNHPRVISLAGRTTLRELVTLYTLADVIVTNDSGPAHFAALTPIRIVSLFGPETPELYGPLSRHNRSLRADLACSPCIHVFNYRDSPCSNNRCMQEIPVEAVFDAIRQARAG